MKDSLPFSKMVLKRHCLALCQLPKYAKTKAGVAWDWKTALDLQTDRPPTTRARRTAPCPHSDLFLLCASVRPWQSSHIGLLSIVDGGAMCENTHTHTVDNSRQRFFSTHTQHTLDDATTEHAQLNRHFLFLCLFKLCLMSLFLQFFMSWAHTEANS